MPATKRNKTMELAVGLRYFPIALSETAREIADWDVHPDIDINSALQNAFDHSIDYPPLSQAIVANDRIALAIEPGLPQMIPIVEGVITYLLEQAVRSDQISVMLAQEHESLVELLTARLEDLSGAAIDVRFHHGQDPKSMGYLAAANGSEPIYVDRLLIEADVVLPITCARDPNGWAYAGLYGIVPWFTDVKTQQRWRHDYTAKARDWREKRSRAAKEVAWLLGIQPVLAVVAGPRGCIDSLCFGSAESVEKKLIETCSTRSIPIPTDPVELLVCSIDGDQDQQTWDNVARILEMAGSFLQPNGIIAILTELQEKPGSVFRWLSGFDNPEETERHLLKSSHSHSLAAIEIHRALRKHSIFMMSQLPSDQLDELGIGVISNIHELEHLIASHPSSLIISGAQHRRVDRR